MTTILSQNTFVPHEYSTLDTYDQSIIPISYYNRCINWYNRIADTEFLEITYLSDDCTIKGIIVKPKIINTKLPLIIYNRGGSNDSGKITVCTLKQKIYFWTQQGYVVLASQYRGVDGNDGTDELGGNDVNDILNIINIAETLPYIDRDNIYMVGHSRGAMMSLMALRYDIPIKALALTGAVTDLFALEQLRPDLIPLFHELIPGMPNNKQTEYIKRSALFWANEINIPTLIMHGDSDIIIDVSQSQSLAEIFKQYNKKYKLILYPKGSHSLIEHQNNVNNEIMTWFKNPY